MLTVLVALGPLAAPSPATGGASPRLVVLIVIDQFRQDYLVRFRDLFLPPTVENGDPGGFRYLLDRGAVFTNCHYDHNPTHTAVGHATLVTGAWPSVHGMVGNTWYDAGQGKTVEAVSDPAVRLVGGDKGQASSPSRLKGSTLGDELKLSSRGKSLVYTVSVKDRAAVLTGGHSADLALWFDTRSGRWVSSSHYVDELPLWVEEINRSGWAQKQFGYVWRPLLDDDAYNRARRPDHPGSSGEYLALGHTFPHTITGGDPEPGEQFFKALTNSPLGNTFTMDVAGKLLREEPLGQDEFPDLLVVSLSANDKAGHSFGPYSPEMLDLTIRTDRQISGLLRNLDREVGLDHVVVVLAADHGVAPLPEVAVTRGLPAGRLDPGELILRVEEALRKRFGPGHYVSAFTNPHLYLNRELLGESLEEARGLAARAAGEMKGLFGVYAADAILKGAMADNLAARAVARSYYPGRSGDVIVVPEPFWIFNFEDPTGTTHGAPWSYDTHVPLILAGPGIRPGEFQVACTPRDLAPTLSALLNLTPPSGSSGKILWNQCPGRETPCQTK